MHPSCLVHLDFSTSHTCSLQFHLPRSRFEVPSLMFTVQFQVQRLNITLQNAYEILPRSFTGNHRQQLETRESVGYSREPSFPGESQRCFGISAEICAASDGIQAEAVVPRLRRGWGVVWKLISR
jgi:hypothetical protein